MKNTGFNYVNITTKGCEGWLNLFLDDEIIALVQNNYIASRVRACATERAKEPTNQQEQVGKCPTCGINLIDGKCMGCDALRKLI
jgi:hypothetical protein